MFGFNLLKKRNILSCKWNAVIAIVFCTGLLFQLNGRWAMDRLYKLSLLNNMDELNACENNPTVDVFDKIVFEKRFILLYNPPGWFPIAALRKPMAECGCINFELTTDKTLLSSSKAVIFHFPVGTFNVSSPPKRAQDQVWVFFSIEPPYRTNLNVLRATEWTNSFNWSMSYRHDADIYLPYGSIRKRSFVPVKNYSLIYAEKDRMAVMVASNCRPPSKREAFVERLRSYGLQVDVYGKCGDKQTRVKDLDTVVKGYKFYLSFENSFCTDYVTEKLFSRYNSDHILVVRGGANYTKVLPEGHLINVADFAEPFDLANYLNKLGSNRNAYTEFLRRKDEYESIDPFNGGFIPGFCDLCKKLKNVDLYRKVYTDPKTYLRKDNCWSPDT